MTAGAVLGTAALVLVGTAPALPWFIAACLVAGTAQAAVLYQPSFAGITGWYGPARVRPLTVLTLVAGFASTVFAPLTAYLNEPLGWRGTYLVLAGIMVAVTVPLHWFFFNARWSHSPRKDITSAMQASARSLGTGGS
ncbi:MFS transporter [Arthrobacter sp. ISL-30]|uniref:MFS transporter n=1 Tax=Arthrobacter sp. ISL-30 TaxID=2819109 RepID=UPI0020360BE3|nr:MFS transporter [Arthrobacter sp. ISL-30]